jgi:flagellar hook-length control protein FliK
VAEQASNARLSQERIDNLAEQLGTKLKLSHAAGGSQVHLSLRPRELGEVQVQLKISDGIVAATVMVDRAETGKLMQNNLEDVRRALEAQGLVVQDFSVGVRGEQDARFEERFNGSRGADRGAVAGLGTVDDDEPGHTSINPDDLHDGSVSLLA